MHSAQALQVRCVACDRLRRRDSVDVAVDRRAVADRGTDMSGRGSARSPPIAATVLTRAQAARHGDEPQARAWRGGPVRRRGRGKEIVGVKGVPRGCRRSRRSWLDRRRRTSLQHCPACRRLCSRAYRIRRPVDRRRRPARPIASARRCTGERGSPRQTVAGPWRPVARRGCGRPSLAGNPESR